MHRYAFLIFTTAEIVRKAKCCPYLSKENEITTTTKPFFFDEPQQRMDLFCTFWHSIETMIILTAHAMQSCNCYVLCLLVLRMVSFCCIIILYFCTLHLVFMCTILCVIWWTYVLLVSLHVLFCTIQKVKLNVFCLVSIIKMYFCIFVLGILGFDYV